MLAKISKWIFIVIFLYICTSKLNKMIFSKIALFRKIWWGGVTLMKINIVFSFDDSFKYAWKTGLLKRYHSYSMYVKDIKIIYWWIGMKKSRRFLQHRQPILKISGRMVQVSKKIPNLRAFCELNLYTILVLLPSELFLPSLYELFLIFVIKQ